jgi:hypothetical protein
VQGARHALGDRRIEMQPEQRERRGLCHQGDRRVAVTPNHRMQCARICAAGRHLLRASAPADGAAPRYSMRRSFAAAGRRPRSHVFTGVRLFAHFQSGYPVRLVRLPGAPLLPWASDGGRKGAGRGWREPARGPSEPGRSLSQTRRESSSAAAKAAAGSHSSYKPTVSAGAGRSAGRAWLLARPDVRELHRERCCPPTRV